MSTTSSSECEGYRCWPNCEPGHNTSYRSAFGSNPFYPTMGHPLVYYAQTPLPRNLQHSGRNRERGNPNCFVKAFRWYTREHRSHRNDAPKADMSGFATWLDVKYDQYLEENLTGSELYHVKLKQTFEAERVPNNNCCEPCTPNRFPGKSHWKKKRRAKSNDTAAEKQKSNQSCRYIMQPKDMSRPPSVCCPPSNGTITVSECGKKTLRRSQSFSNVSLVVKGKEPCNVPPPPCDVCDTKTKASICQNFTTKNANIKGPDEKVESKPSVCHNNTCKYVNGKEPNEKVEVSTKNNNVVSEEFGCQFGERITTKVSAETQYDKALPNSRRDSLRSNQSTRSVACDCLWAEKNSQRLGGVPQDSIVYQPMLPCELSRVECGCKSLDTMPRKPTTRNATWNSQKNVHLKHVECQCPGEKAAVVDAPTQYVPRPTKCFDSNICECDFKEFISQQPMQSVPMQSNPLPLFCERKIKEEIVVERVTFAQTTSQTSNYSLHLEKETVHEYPLFLKIVCADKLSNQNMK